MSLTEVMEVALALPYEEREALVREMLLSLDPEEGQISEEEWEAAVATVWQQRLAQFDSGQATTRDGAEAMAEIRERQRNQWN